MSIRRVFVPVLALLLAAPLGAQSAVPMPAFDPSSIDRKYGACQDFFMFANNGWIERNPIPAAFSSWGAFNELTERNTLVLKGILERAAAEASTTTDPGTRKLGTFYATCMDSAAAERAGIEPIADELRRIEAIADREQLRDQIARMHSLGYGGAFGFGSTPDPRDARRAIAYATQGGLALPDRVEVHAVQSGLQAFGRDRDVHDRAGALFPLRQRGGAADAVAFDRGGRLRCARLGEADDPRERDRGGADDHSLLSHAASCSRL